MPRRALGSHRQGPEFALVATVSALRADFVRLPLRMAQHDLRHRTLERDPRDDVDGCTQPGHERLIGVSCDTEAAVHRRIPVGRSKRCALRRSTSTRAAGGPSGPRGTAESENAAAFGLDDPRQRVASATSSRMGPAMHRTRIDARRRSIEIQLGASGRPGVQVRLLAGCDASPAGMRLMRRPRMCSTVRCARAGRRRPI